MVRTPSRTARHSSSVPKGPMLTGAWFEELLEVGFSMRYQSNVSGGSVGMAKPRRVRRSTPTKNGSGRDLSFSPETVRARTLVFKVGLNSQNGFQEECALS